MKRARPVLQGGRGKELVMHSDRTSSPSRPSSPDERDEKIARSVRLRIGLIRGELREWAARSQETAHVLDDQVEHVDQLADQLFDLEQSLRTIQARQAQRASGRP